MLPYCWIYVLISKEISFGGKMILSFPEPWRSLSEAYGGKLRLAKILGVDPKTLYRWAHGLSSVSHFAQKEINRLAKKKSINFPMGVHSDQQ
jgi:hypothetical protein